MQVQVQSSKNLKKQLARSIFAFAIALIVVCTASFAWYIYNTNKHTTNVKMAAGAGKSLLISNKYDGKYETATELSKFTAKLQPLSTNNVLNGFYKVKEFDKSAGASKESFLARWFEVSQREDYYKTSLYLRSTKDDTKVYISDIGFEESDPDNPISTAIRVGLAVHPAASGQQANKQFIFEINNKKNPQAHYNTYGGESGEVLSGINPDGTGILVPFTPLNQDNYCNYDKDTLEASLKPASALITTLNGNKNGKTAEERLGAPVQVDVYIWIEGCDEDCTSNLNNKTLKTLAISFASVNDKDK